MFGFSIIYNNHSNLEFSSGERISYTSPISKKCYDFFYEKHSKFSDDKLFIENEDFIVGIDGVILNLQQLKTAFGVGSLDQLMACLIKNKAAIPNHLTGDFSGFIFTKETEELSCFVNQVGSSKFYYYQNNDSILISHQLDAIVGIKETSSLNIEAAYQLLNFGGMLHNNTLVQGVFRLQAGEQLYVKNDQLTVEKYNDYNAVSIIEQSKTNIINQLNELFISNIKMEYEKDVEYNYKHLATLSGGLDSRMNVMTAHELGYNTYDFCFSQTDYLDHEISKQISEDLGNNYQFIPLDDASYLTHLDDNLANYDGLIFYLASAHFNHAVQQLPKDNFGLMHTGQIGDAILGGFVSKDKPNFFSAQMSSKLAHRLNPIDTSNFANEEVFKLYNRLFNVTVAGSYTSAKHGHYLVSPFLNDAFIKLSLSIPKNYKLGCAIYIDWINELRPEIAKYRWEKTGFKPNANWKSELSRYTKKARQVISKSPQSMNPYDHWYATKPFIQDFFKDTFSKNLEKVTNNELRADLSLMFDGNTIEKALAITLVAAINKFQLKN